MLYLSYDDWSPRYDPTSFYTLQFTGYVLVSSKDQLESILLPRQHDQSEEHQLISTTPSIINNRCSDTLPTFYYKILIFSGHNRTIIYRSSAQFLSLYQQLQAIDRKSLPTQQRSVSIPHPIHGSSHDYCCRTIPFFQQIQAQLQYYSWRYQFFVSNVGEDSTCFDTNIVPYAETRMQHLKQFLLFVLEECGPTYSSHISVQTFLDI